jgi:undecaprenyl-diphosphatase
LAKVKLKKEPPVDFLIGIDHALFAKINLDWTNSFFDWLFPNITDLYKDPRLLLVVLPLLSFWVFKQRAYAVKWILITLLSVAVSDLFSYRVVKPLVARQRPQPAGVEVVLRTQPTTSLSFPSNHATNMFATATALSGGLPFLAPLFYLIALLIAYSRVYDGVHFPLDILAGAVLGTLVALAFRRLFARWLTKENSPKLSDNALGDSVIRSAEGSSRERR